MNETIIGWTNVSWNPASGCSKVSDGCRFCYAATISAKFKQTTKPWTIQNEAENVVIKPHKLHEPYTLGDKPQRCFVNSTSDLFHRVIPDWYRAAVFCVMLDLPYIIFQVLTKRSEALIDWPDRFAAAVRSPEFEQFAASVKHKKVQAALGKATTYATPWGANIWQGVSVEDARVLQRIEHLRQSRAAVKFISAEPLLGSWGQVDLSSIDWIIAGGESGKHLNQTPERFMKQEWAREIKRLCIDQHIAFFYKQDSGHTTELRKYLVEEDGSLWRWNQYPNDFRPPMFVSDKDEPLRPVKFQHNDADPTVERSFEDCLRLAQLAEHAAYERAVAVPTAPHWSENAALAAAYWYEAAARLRPALPPLPADDLEALRAGSDERIEELLRPRYTAEPTRIGGIRAWEVMNDAGDRIFDDIADANDAIELAHMLNDHDISDPEHAKLIAQVWNVRQVAPNGDLPDVLWKTVLGTVKDRSALKKALAEVDEPPPTAPEPAVTWDTLTDPPAKTTVVNFRDVSTHWNRGARAWDDPRYVYIGRFMPGFNLPSSMFANPFKISADTPTNRAAAIEQYRTWIKSKLADQHEGEKYRAELEALRGKTLVCFCKPKACHGDILRELLGEAVDHVEPPKPEEKPVQMSLFGEDEAPVKKTVYA